MKLRLFITIIIAKLSILACRVFKHGGTSFPGKIARVMFPNMLSVVASKLKVIFITGTNGKTTTARIIARMLEESGVKYISNKSGANLVSGVFTSFIQYANLKGEINADIAIIEIDEVTFPLMADYLQPDILIVTNFFKDQLDRYDKLDTPLTRVREGITKCKNTQVILNADDSLCVSLSHSTTKKPIFYGFGDSAYSNNQQPDSSDATLCINCKSKYVYSFNTYGHLGGFKCTSCGYERPAPDVSVINVEELSNAYSKVTLSLTKDVFAEDQNQNTITATINFPGLYNIYNALAAIACATQLSIPFDKIKKGVENFESGFGRMETIKSYGKTIRLILVKNPIGLNQIIDYLISEQNQFIVSFLINDNAADGADISWLWDVDFEKLLPMQNRIKTLVGSGIRAHEVAVRLKYAGIEADKIAIMADYNSLLDVSLEMLEQGQTLYLIPNYTALLDIRKLLNKKFKLKKFWE